MTLQYVDMYRRVRRVGLRPWEYEYRRILSSSCLVEKLAHWGCFPLDLHRSGAYNQFVVEKAKFLIS